MNQQYKNKLESIASDDLLIESFKLLFSERIEKEKPNMTETDNDTLIGQKYRAYEQARFMIEESFNDLENYNTVIKQPNKLNKER